MKLFIPVFCLICTISLAVCAKDSVLINGKCWKLANPPAAATQRLGVNHHDMMITKGQYRPRLVPQNGDCPDDSYYSLRYEDRTHRNIVEWCESKK